MKSANSAQTPYQSQLEPFDYNQLNITSKTLDLPSKTKPYPEFINESTIKQSTEIFTNVREKISSILEAYGKLKERVHALSTEHKLQTKMLQKMTVQVQEHAAKCEPRSQKYAKIKAKYEKQSKQISSILELLFDLTQPRLSAQEIQWFNDLAALASRCSTTYTPAISQVFNYN